VVGLTPELVVEVVEELTVLNVPADLVFVLVFFVLIFVSVVETEDDLPLQHVPNAP